MIVSTEMKKGKMLPPPQREIFDNITEIYFHRVISESQWRVLVAMIRSNSMRRSRTAGRVSFADIQERTGYSKRTVSIAMNGRRGRDLPGLLQGSYRSLNLMARQGHGTAPDGSNEVPMYYINWKRIGDLARKARS